MNLTKEQREVFSYMGKQAQKKISAKERVRRAKLGWARRRKLSTVK